MLKQLNGDFIFMALIQIGSRGWLIQMNMCQVPFAVKHCCKNEKLILIAVFQDLDKMMRASKMHAQVMCAIYGRTAEYLHPFLASDCVSDH